MEQTTMAQSRDEEMDDSVVEFTVRNDRYRGILIEQMEYNDDIYFFKHQDMPIHRHCEQIQRIVGTVGVQRSKKIRVDATEFSYEYFADNVPRFKGCLLHSTKLQMKKVADSFINKEIGAKKRSITVAQNKGRKHHEKKNIFWERMQEADAYYQAERKKRMAEAFGAGVLPNTTFVPPQERTVSLPMVSVASSSAPLPAATVRPYLESQINGQEPMNQDLPDDADHNI
jgi:hypothetical protein